MYLICITTISVMEQQDNSAGRLSKGNHYKESNPQPASLWAETKTTSDQHAFFFLHNCDVEYTNDVSSWLKSEIIVWKVLADGEH